MIRHGSMLPSNGAVSSLHQILKITPTLRIPKNARILRRQPHLLPIRSQASESVQPESNGTSAPTSADSENSAVVGSQDGSSNGTAAPPPSPVKSLAAKRSEALTSLLRSTAVPDAAVAKQLGLTEDYLQTLMELPGTSSITELKTRLVALSQWQSSLRRGVLPTAGSVDWPAEPFRSKFIDVLKKLEMPRFTRRYPKLLNSLLKQFLEMAKEFEGELLEEQAKQQQKQEQQQQQQQQQMSSQSANNSDDQESQKSDQENSQSGMNGDEKEDPDGQSEKADEQGDASGQEGNKGEIQMELENMEGGQSDPKNATPTDADPSSSQDNSGFAEKLAEQMLEKFEENWAPAMEALDTASQAFEDIDGLMDGPEGFDSSKSVWQQSGWREVASLRKKLEELRELRELVRSLGRGGGKGPIKKAPQQLYKTGAPPGVIRTEQSPEETRGLTRSGDLSRMLPMESHLLAAGWPRKRSSSSRNNNNNSGEESSIDYSKGEEREGENDDVMVKEGGSRACRLLFMARRAERQLMSYERTGWSENEPSRVTGRLEMRPAAELGPIIVCLDTSGSMHGAREVVAKALTLECMRGAHRQGRKCFVYAFSGPGDVMDLELGNDSASMNRLLNFLTMSFSGGTDVDAPLALSLERLTREEWGLADILMVTDGEIPSPNEDILKKLELATETMGLEVHGLLVGRNVTEPMKELCTHLHVFKSWSAVGGDNMNY